MISSTRNFALRLLLIFLVLAVWEALVRLFSIPPFILPQPSNIFIALYRGIASRLYIDHIGVTLLETLIGFAVGTTLAFVLGTAVALSRRTEYFLYPFIVMFQAMPKVALAPLILVWFGLGLASKVVTAALVAFFPLLVNTIVGLRSADEDRVNLMRSLAASRWQLFRMLQLPNAMPYIFAGLAVALLQGLDVDVVGSDGVTRSVPLAAHWGLALAPRLLGEPTAQALAASAAWSVVPLLALAVALGLVARRPGRSEPGR